jgi:hypothetical protein
MQTIRQLACLVLFFVSPLFAQSLGVGPGEVLEGGSLASLTYNNSARPNQTIVVLVTGGDPETTVEVEIRLDGAGNGTASWSVPTTWSKATFNAPDVNEQVVPID